MKLPRPLSHSSISLYTECPQKYKFKYIDKIPEKPRHFFSFGQSVHLALEYFYGVKEPKAPSLEDLLKSYREQWVKGGYRDQAHEDELFEEGRRILTRFHDKHSKDFALPFFVEYAFNFEVEGVPVTGRIDRVDKLPDGRLSVLDYKTGKQLATGRIDVDAQLTMYQIACEKGLGAEVGELVFYHLPTLKQHRSTRRPGTLVDELKTKVVVTADSIVNEKFDPKPSENVCKWCDFKPICPIFKDQSAGSAGPAKGERVLAGLVDAYGDALLKVDAAKAEAEAAGKALGEELKKRGYARAFGDRHEVAAAAAVRWDFLDKKKVLEIVKQAGLYDRILAPSAPLVNKLMEDAALAPDLRARLTEIGERVETTELKVKTL